MKIKHKVKAITRDKDGNIISIHESTNSITDGDPSTNENGLIMALDLITGADEYYDSTKPVKRMRLGKGTPTDAGLGSPYGNYVTGTLSTIDVTDPTAPEITITGTWGAGAGTGFSGVTEVGLFNTDTLGDFMFAFDTFSPPASKTDSGTFTVEWTLITN